MNKPAKHKLDQYAFLPRSHGCERIEPRCSRVLEDPKNPLAVPTQYSILRMSPPHTHFLFVRSAHVPTGYRHFLLRAYVPEGALGIRSREAALYGVVEWDLPHSLGGKRLHPRSRRVMFAEVDLKSRDQVFAFVDFLQANPHRKPQVRSLIVPPTDFGPSLLYLLPYLSEIRCISSEPQASAQSLLALHHVSLACFGRLGTQIRALHLANVSFAGYMAFARILLALANVTHLVCTDVVIQTAGNRASQGAIRRRLSKQMQLKTLGIDSPSLTGRGRDASVGALLFDSDFAPSTVESLTFKFIGVLGSDTFLHLSDWSRLRTLVLQLPSFEWGNVADVAMLLTDLRRPTLREIEVGIELDLVADLQVMGELLSYSRHQPQAYLELEAALLRFPQPRIVCVVKAPMRAGSGSFWTQEFGKYLPGLFQRGALVVKSDQPVLAAGHEARLLALVGSQNSEWVASGSDDSTIILWDTNGHITQRWVAHRYKSVWSLAFSPDSQHLVSVGRDEKVAIWDLSQGVCKVATLEGHTGTVVSCAWSPSDGNVIATGSWDGTAQLWDAHTFRQLRVLERSGHWQIRSVAFSHDGRWLSSKSSRDYWIWDVALTTLHKSIQPTNNTSLRSTDIPTAFDPGSMRLATAFSPVTVEIWDVNSEAGGRLFALGQGGWVNDVSFSPDGKLLLVVLENRMAKVWDAHTGVELFRLQGHTRGLSAACISKTRPLLGRLTQDAQDA
ncbi:WD40-repeat-containing domain protein [Ganoderma leucocontextum]|nr:WD40-repeat-containing domain protein [Ganoderma leucocontextum]